MGCSRGRGQARVNESNQRWSCRVVHDAAVDDDGAVHVRGGEEQPTGAVCLDHL